MASWINYDHIVAHVRQQTSLQSNNLSYWVLCRGKSWVFALDFVRRITPATMCGKCEKMLIKIFVFIYHIVIRIHCRLALMKYFWRETRQTDRQISNTDTVSFRYNFILNLSRQIHNIHWNIAQLYTVNDSLSVCMCESASHIHYTFNYLFHNISSIHLFLFNVVYELNLHKTFIVILCQVHFAYLNNNNNLWWMLITTQP